MKLKILIAIIVTSALLGIVATVSKASNTVELQQVDLKTKQQEIEIKTKKSEELQRQLENAHGDLKKLKSIEEENKQLQKDIEKLQAKKAEEKRIAEAKKKSLAEQALNAVTHTQTVQASDGSTESIIRQAATRHGVDPNYLVYIARCESGLNGNSVNYNYFDNGHPSGLFQHISGYWPSRAAKYGYSGASVFDVTAQANVTAQMFKDGLQGLWECK